MGERSRRPWSAFALVALGSSGITYTIASPSDTESRHARHYEDVFDTASRHERCLKELSNTSSPETCQEAKAAVSRMRSRADQCFHGRW